MNEWKNGFFIPYVSVEKLEEDRGEREKLEV